MSTIKEELLAAIEVASDEVLAQTLLFIKKSISTYVTLCQRLFQFLQKQEAIYYKNSIISCIIKEY